MQCEEGTKEVQIRPMRIQAKTYEEEQFAVIDSGATNCVRPRNDEDKDDELMPAMIDLVGRYNTEMMISPCGTVIGEKGIQVIVPMMSLIEDLGYQIVQNGTELQIVHPQCGGIKTVQFHGALYTSKQEGLKLVEEIEVMQRMRKISTSEMRADVTNLRQAIEGEGFRGFEKSCLLYTSPSPRD